MAGSTRDIIYSKGDTKMRYAVAADYDSVVAINDNIYEGLDYIPEQYFYYLNRPGTECFVMKIKDQVVGFVMITLIDEGKSILIHADRFKPDMGYLKYAMFFTGVAALHVVLKNPQVTNVVATSRPELDNVHKRNSILKLHTIPFEMNTLMFRTRELHQLTCNKTERDIWQIEGETMKTWLLAHGKPFFPVYIQMDYYPFQYLPGNIDTIVNERKAVCFVSKYQGNIRTYRGVSFHVTHGTIRRGVMCIFHYYGDDITDFENHLKEHLKLLKVTKKVPVDEEVHIHCNFQQIFSHSEVTTMARKYGLRDGLMRPAVMLIQKVKDFEQTVQTSVMLSKL